MRVFHQFGAVASVVAIGVSLALGGDPSAQVAFWIGAAVLGLANVALARLARSPASGSPAQVGILWAVATAGILPALYYFGPCSAVLAVLMLGQVFIALGQSRATARAVAGVAMGGHVAVAAPIIFGWIPDVGLLSSAGLSREQLVIAEALILALLAAGYGLGRWVRDAAASALAELAVAQRVIGDQQQVLAEVRADHERANRQNEGRWTGQLVGEYRLGLVIGRGAMGEVYDAVATRDGRPAAVKLLGPRATSSGALVERFHREMEVAGKLVSPHIVRVLDVALAGAAVPYIAMERLHGTDLAARLRATPRLPLDEVVALVAQVAEALEVARRAGVVHRDLKPHNLFLHQGATWKVLDFGVSKLADGDGTLTGEGIVGTPQYMAPEQATGGAVSHAADVYALGAIAYRCLTGRAPFRGKDLAEVIYQLVHAAPMRPGLLARVAPEVEHALAVALAKAPARRFSSAAAFGAALAAARLGVAPALPAPATAWSG
jgi:serine/threonine-protein kinase